MEDTIGQAAMLTGGYSNSYAASVGAQAYNDQMSRLNDVIPTLQGLALDRYNAEGQALKDRYNMLSDADQLAYSRYADQRDNDIQMLKYYADAADEAHSVGVSDWKNRLAALGDAADAAGALYDDAVKAETEEYDRGMEQEKFQWQKDTDARDYSYKVGRDAVEDAKDYAKLGSTTNAGTVPAYAKDRLDQFLAEGKISAAETLIFDLYEAGEIDESTASGLLAVYAPNGTISKTTRGSQKWSTQ